MNTRKTFIEDIYSGLPDAKDSILYEGEDQFIDAYVIPPDFNMEGLITGNKCFITGNKGIGKTAALRYLSYRLSKLYGNTRSSFLLFDQDYSQQQRNEMVKQMAIHMTFDKDSEVEIEDFSDLWKWHLFQIIMRDNDVEKKDRIFVHDETWKKFCRIVNGILSPEYRAKLSGNINMEVPFFKIFSANMSIELPELEFGKKKLSFSEALEAAEKCFLELDRRSCPYYLFVDELDVCYSEKPVFQRDLRLVRDLIHQTRCFNTIFQKSGWHHTKIFCTVRPEILRAIDHTLSSGTILKQLVGFDCPLVWNVPGTETFERPVMKLFLKRIGMAESDNGENRGSEVERYQRWFPEPVENLEPSEYIKRITWSKPRDIVRILDCAKILCGNRQSFTESVFRAIAKRYSAQSCMEISGELEAVYSAHDITRIMNSLRGWKTIFSLDEFKERIKKYGGTLHKDLNIYETAHNLYRAGAFGLYQARTGKNQWNHLDETEFLLNDDWQLIIHQGLWEELALTPASGPEASSYKKAAAPGKSKEQTHQAAFIHPRSKQETESHPRTFQTEEDNPERLFNELVLIADNMSLTLQQLNPLKRQEPFAAGMAEVHKKLSASLEDCSTNH